MRSPSMLCVFLTLMSATAAGATETPTALRGTEGLSAVPVEIRNETSLPIACAASIAHWYSAELGRAGPGETLALPLWSDPATGTVVTLNAVQDRMPVLALWCGLAGRDVSTRSDIPLVRRAGAPEPAVRRACTVDSGTNRLDCRPF